ncbi:MAG TPA: D-Ala-D-Ala carboxypeptidase family metallohydrolase [Saliniramus sp.]|nr:D-Ala-D-Ala carboxypeptidase family metallohydrolase [Saliniramus sp.]
MRFYPRPIRLQLRSRRIRNLLAAVFCAASIIATPFATGALAEEIKQVAPVPSDQSGWIPPEPKKTDRGAGDDEYAALVQPGPSLSGEPKKTLGGFRNHIEAGAITLRRSTPTNCLPGNLKTVVADLANRFGTVSIQSTHRSPQRNRRAGGARRSLHLECRAIDFRVKARGREVMTFLREHKAVGGLKMYRNGIIHIDNGERRSW